MSYAAVAPWWESEASFGAVGTTPSTPYAADATLSHYVLSNPAASKFEELAEIGRLRANWDGYGAEAIGAVTAERARQILMRVDTLPDTIEPTPAGTVTMEWETPVGRASLEVGQTTYSFYTAPVIGEPIRIFGETQVQDAEDIRFALATLADAPADASVSVLDWSESFEAGH